LNNQAMTLPKHPASVLSQRGIGENGLPVREPPMAPVPRRSKAKILSLGKRMIDADHSQISTFYLMRHQFVVLGVAMVEVVSRYKHRLISCPHITIEARCS